MRELTERDAAKVFHHQSVAVTVGFETVRLNDAGGVEVFGDRVLIAKPHEFAEARMLIPQQFDDCGLQVRFTYCPVHEGAGAGVELLRDVIVEKGDRAVRKHKTTQLISQKLYNHSSFFVEIIQAMRMLIYLNKGGTASHMVHPRIFERIPTKSEIMVGDSFAMRLSPTNANYHYFLSIHKDDRCKLTLTYTLHDSQIITARFNRGRSDTCTSIQLQTHSFKSQISKPDTVG